MNGDGTRTGDYEFEIPADRIAQSPAERRDDSRLMVVHRATGNIEHRRFRDIADMIPAGDVVALNTTRVFRARLLGVRDSGAPAELLLLRPLGDGIFEAMVHPGGKLRPGRRVTIGPDLEAEILEVTERRTRIVQLHSTLPVNVAVDRYGQVPLPHYIRRDPEATDEDRYQTVYAREPGSVAVPSAGLHFTPELLDKLEKKGVKRAELVLHVGAGTFKPVEADDPADHEMHEEQWSLPASTAAILNEARCRGANVWAVGTTSVRTLESAILPDGTFQESAGDTALFIRPPFEFRAVQRLVTNFHLPRSTLVMLVAAFAGYELTMHAYDEALAEGYRFYSYGDAMVII